MKNDEKAAQLPEDLSYDAAQKELEEILSSLKNDQVSIDKLEEVVARAAILSNYCSEKLRNTEAKVQSIIDKLEL